MKNSLIRRVIALGLVTIMGIVGLQAYWVVSTWDINEEEFNQKVNLALYRVAQSLAELNNSMLPSRNIVRQRTSNYYVVNMEDEIDPGLLEYFLQVELEALALNIDFEYAVFDCSSNEMVYGNYCSYNPDHEPREKPSLLPRAEDLNYYFGVRFPTRSSYLFTKMQLSIIFTVILLLTILFFGFSMFVILRQKRLSELQKDFINNMTHEFKTPLSTIKISADVFLSAPEVVQNTRLKRYAEIIRDQNQRLDDQVQKVLQLAKLERNSFALKPEKVELAEVISQVCQSASVKVRTAGGHLQQQLPEGKWEVMADRFHLTNVLHNLIDNAIKYSGSKPQIRVKASVDHAHVYLTVEDNGPGIAPEYQTKVFEKFYRIPTGDVHDVKGFGLGLFYVKRICEAQGWGVKLDSSPPDGTQITIKMPKAA